MHHSDELDKIAPALVALQADLKPVSRGAENPFFRSRYAPLPDVSAALQPILAKNNLALTVIPAVVNGVNGLRFMLIHTSGQFLSGEWMLNPAKRDPQGEGGDTTYKRRYGMMALTGLVADEDDDGHAASQPAQEVSLTQAKTRLRNAIKKSGAPGSEYAWVAKATSSDVGEILDAAKALEALTSGAVLVPLDGDADA